MLAWLQSRGLREGPFVIVLLIEAVGVILVGLAPQHWLRAVGVMTAGMAVGGLFRLVLTDEQAGLLRVRRRGFDVACYWGLAAVATLVALGLPQR